MGDKYIIELENKPFHKEDGDFLYRVKGFNSLVFDMTGIGKLTPYTEPDLERVKKTAHDDGYSAGYQAGRGELNRVLSDVESDVEQVRKEAFKNGYDAACKDIDIKSKTNAAYRKGLEDAWEAAKKIALMDTETSENVTGYFGLFRIMENLTPMQAIEKIRQYEQEQEAEIKVGDVVRMKNAPEVEIWVTATSDEDGGLLSGLALKTVDDYCDMGGIYVNRSIDNFEHTGKHYDMPTVLEKVREES